MKVTATKLENPDIRFVSLVERGANRVPFRVIKKEKGMIDLHRLFKTDKAAVTKAEAVPGVLGIAVMKQDDMESIGVAIKAAGYDFPHLNEFGDGTCIFAAKADAVFDSAVAVKMNDEVIVLVENITADDVVSKSDTFAEFYEQYKFLPGLDMANAVLGTSMSGAVTKSEDKAAVAVGIAKAASDFSAYASALVEFVPSEAFTAAEQIAKACAKKPMTAEEKAAEDAAAANAAKSMDGDADDKDKDCKKDEATVAADAASTDEAGKKTEDEAAAVEAAAKAAAPAADATDAAVIPNGDGVTDAAPAADEATVVKAEVAPEATQVDVAAAVAAAVADVTSQFSEALSEIRKSLAGVDTLTASVSEVQKSVETATQTIANMETRVAEVESVAKAAKDSVEGITISQPPAGDHTPSAGTAKKSEGGFPGGLIDTAFMPRSQRLKSAGR